MRRLDFTALLLTNTPDMFKSSFAQEVLEETKSGSSVNLLDAILPAERHTLYKSQFAATTHGPLDNVSFERTGEEGRTSRPASQLGGQTGTVGSQNNNQTEFHTSGSGPARLPA